MKSILKYLGLAGLAAGIFAACEHPDISEIFDGDAMSQEENIAYMYSPSVTNHSWQYRASAAEGGYTISPEISMEFPLTQVELARPAENDVTVTLDYDLEALEALNAELVKAQGEDAKQYKLFEKSKLNALSFDFAAGEDAKPLVLNFDTDEIFSGDESHYFALPLRIVSVSDNSLISTNAGSFLLTFDIDYAVNEVKFSASSSSYALQIFENGELRNDLQEAQLCWLNANNETAETTTVKLRINNDLIASSNYPDDLPVPNVKLEKETMVIDAEQRQSDFIKLLFPNGLKALEPDKNYQIPVEIVSVTGRGAGTGEPSVYTYRITTSTFRPTYISFNQTEYTFTAKFTEDGKLTNAASSITTNVNAVASKTLTAGCYAYLKIDNSLIDAYNQQNGTQYAPVEKVSLYYSYIYFQANTTSGYSSYNVRLTFNDNMASLKSGQDYLIPVCFDEFQSSDTNVTEGLTDNILYIKIESSVIPAAIILPASGPTGAEIPRDNLQAWTINANNPDVKGTEQTTNVKGQGTGFYFLFNTSASGLLVDLGAVYDLTGMKFASSSTFGVSYCVKTFSMEVSTDGNTWTDLGQSEELEKAIVNYAKLAKTTQARYIRLFLNKSGGNYDMAYLDPKVGLMFYQL